MTINTYIDKLFTWDKSYPKRTQKLTCLKALLDGSFYDGLSYEFAQERADDGTYIEIHRRRPSVQTGTRLTRTVVEQNVAMLFGEGRFPAVSAGSPEADTLLRDFIRETKLVQVMQQAAFEGSVGSTAIQLRVLPNRKNQNRAFFAVHDTRYLEPEWDPNEPDRLIKITEKKKTTGRELKRLGYAVPAEDLDKSYWFCRVFDEQAERWFLPSLNADEADQIEDTAQSVVHDLGFCPWVWIKNLHGGDDLDGQSTFESAMLACIEIDYLASQVGRGLRYSMDPLLVIKEPPAPAAMDTVGNALDPNLPGWTDSAGRAVGQTMTRSADTALTIDASGDAKILELSGSAAEAVMSQVEKLRQYAMESMSGVLVNPDQINSHQGAKALEVLHAPLIRQTDAMRSSYGEEGLLPLLRMFVETAQSRPLFVNGKLVKIKAEPSQIELHWHSWFPDTAQDLLTGAQALEVHIRNGLISAQTGTAIIAPSYDIANVKEERARVDAEVAAKQAKEQAALQAQADIASASEPDEEPAKPASKTPTEASKTAR